MGTSASAGSWSEDLSAIEGTLHREQLEGGFWSLAFGDEHAPHGGRLVLGESALLSGFSDGSRVRVRGRVSEGHASIFMAGTTYEVLEVHPLG